MRDVAAGPHTRIYHFAGTEHGLGVWPPADTTPIAADPSGWIERSQNLRGIVNYGRLLRACLVHLDAWVTEGIEPPASRHPRVSDGTAVPTESLAKVFERVPGAAYPRHHARPRRLDFGADAELRVMGQVPPREGPRFGSLVSAVDEDGNEVAGIAVPEVRVPLATHTGWTLRHPDIGGAEQLLVFAGATLPFARTRQERETTGDPRRSVEERYASRAAYLEAVRGAARRAGGRPLHAGGGRRALRHAGRPHVGLAGGLGAAEPMARPTTSASSASATITSGPISPPSPPGISAAWSPSPSRTPSCVPASPRSIATPPSIRRSTTFSSGVISMPC